MTAFDHTSELSRNRLHPGGHPHMPRRSSTAGSGLDALEQALHDRRPVQGSRLVHHSGRGSQGGFKRSSQRDIQFYARHRSRASAGVAHSRVFRGRALRVAAMAASVSALCTLRSVPFGKYWRSSPLVFSLEPRCQGL
jgi:hypothetical protein